MQLSAVWFSRALHAHLPVSLHYVLTVFLLLVCYVLCLFSVRQAREAALDAQLLVLATDLGKEKASQLHAEGSAFDPSAFAEHLVSNCEGKAKYYILPCASSL